MIRGRLIFGGFLATVLGIVGCGGGDNERVALEGAGTGTGGAGAAAPQPGQSAQSPMTSEDAAQQYDYDSPVTP